MSVLSLFELCKQKISIFDFVVFDRKNKILIKSDPDLMIHLLEIGGLNLDETDEFGMTVLMTAILTRDVELVKMLLVHKHDLNIQETEFGKTALMYAYDTQIINLLLHSGADPNIKDKFETSAIDYAMMRNNIEGASDILLSPYHIFDNKIHF